MERETGFEPATSTLARSHSTTELFPLTVVTTRQRFNLTHASTVNQGASRSNAPFNTSTRGPVASADNETLTTSKRHGMWLRRRAAM
jgi:hypothetical protein